MTSVHEVTESLLWTYTTVLPVGDGVCRICHSAPNAGYSICYSCEQTMDQVSRPVSRVVPICLTASDNQLHHSLRKYKDDVYTPPSIRRRFSVQIAALFTRFLSNHRACIAARASGGWDCITYVPSTRRRTGEHPLNEALCLSPWLDRQLEQLLAPGPGRATHNAASDDAFSLVHEVAGQRVLLLDDTFTSGARGQSAASTLQLGGAQVVALVPAGRYVDPMFSQESADLLRKARAYTYSFDYCCVGHHPLPPRRTDTT